MRQHTYNTDLIDCGTPAVRRWLPQALVLPTFLATFLSTGKRLLCGALRWFTVSSRDDGNQA